MKLLFVNQAFYPDVAATAQYLQQIAVACAARGHDVTVLCAAEAYAGTAADNPAELPGVRTIRVRTAFNPKGSPWRRVANAALTNLNMALRLGRLRDFDEIVVLTSPPMIACASSFMVGRRARLTHWVMDLNPDQAVEMGWIPRDSIRHRLLEAALRRVLKRFDRVFVLDRFMQERLVSKGGRPEKIEVVPLWADTKAIMPIAHEDNVLRKHRDWDDKFVVMYSGNLSPCHPLDTMLDAARELRDEPSVLFCFAGGGALASHIESFQRTHGLSNIVCLGYEPYERLALSLCSADLHIVSMGEAMVGIVHPSKVYGILAAGRPYALLGPPTSPPGELLATLDLPWQVNHGDATKLVEIIRAAKDIGLSATSGRCRRLAMSYSLDGFLDRLLSPTNATHHRRAAGQGFESQAMPEQHGAQSRI